MKNQYGLDADYFKKNLKILLRDVNNYTPGEMRRSLLRLADVAMVQPSADWPGIPAGPNQPFPGR